MLRKLARVSTAALVVAIASLSVQTAVAPAAEAEDRYCITIPATPPLFPDPIEICI